MLLLRRTLSQLILISSTGLSNQPSLSVSEKSFDSKGNPRIATTGLNSNWRLYKVGVDELLGDGLFVLQNTETGKVLDIENGAPSQGQKLVATEGEGRGTSSQRFRIHIVGNV
ncbi:RICIN domain-containing protein [Enterococcus sp. AZ080]|uniref:RICIN domain-containing protein n=1 Tax=Enterococcus sp. AZ080 TaxID=2774793 RepID=UPI003F68D3CA